MRFHVCQSLEGLKNEILRLKRNKKKVEISWLTVDGRPATLKELQEAISDAESKGYDVLPPCDNIKENGHCAGHED